MVWACFRGQVATIFLLTATFISNHTGSRLKAHIYVFQVFSLSFCGSSLFLFSLHILPSSCCLVAVTMILLSLLPSFTHMPWNLLLPFYSRYNFYSPSLKALLLHSLTTHQASCFITLQSFHLYHLGPHAPSLASPLYLLWFFTSNSNFMSYLCSMLNHFCLLFFLLRFISCASWSLDSAHSTAPSSFSPSQVSHQSISSICSLSPVSGKPPCKHQFITQTNKLFSALLFGQRNLTVKA